MTLLLDLFFTKRAPAWVRLLATLMIVAVALLVGHGLALAIGLHRTLVTLVVLFVGGVVLGVAQWRRTGKFPFHMSEPPG